MIFQRKIQKSCNYCTYGTKISEDTVLCAKRGFMPIYKYCRKFEYDPCKRVPVKAKTPDFEKFCKEDFSL